MFNKLNLSVLVIAIACQLFSQVVEAQEGTLADCLAEFDVGLDAVDSGSLAEGRLARCSVNMGEAFVSLRGVWSTDNSWTIQANASLNRNGGTKTCGFRVFRQKEGDTVFISTPSITISGKDAAAWNKCLKGDCCLDAIALAE